MNAESTLVCECVHTKDSCSGNPGKSSESITAVALEFVPSKTIELCSVDSEINRGNAID